MLIDFFKNWNHCAFFKQYSKFDIVFFETSNGAKRIVLHKGGNTKPRVVTTSMHLSQCDECI